VTAVVASTTSEVMHECRRAIGRRFGWLRLELARVGGSVNALPAHYQRLWHGYTAVVGKFNHIGLERDLDKRERGYQKLIRELQR